MYVENVQHLVHMNKILLPAISLGPYFIYTYISLNTKVYLHNIQSTTNYSEI